MRRSVTGGFDGTISKEGKRQQFNGVSERLQKKIHNRPAGTIKDIGEQIRMITDRMDHLINYIPKQYKHSVRGFLAQVSPAMEEKRYEICGAHVFAKVMSYDTQESKNCRIEAHNRYIDIQASITGAEGISVFNRENLRIEQDYDVKEDNLFFDQDDQIPYAASRNMPGIFSMIFPHEAHRPQEKVKGYNNHVKKFVIKMETAEYGR